MPEETTAEPGASVRLARTDDQFLQFLVKSGFLTDQQLTTLIDRSGRDPIVLERYLVEEEYVQPEKLRSLQTLFQHYPFVNLEQVPVRKETASLLPTKVCGFQKVIPFLGEDGKLGVAMVNPSESKFLRLLRKKLGPDVQTFLATDKAIVGVLSQIDVDFEKEFRTMLDVHREAERAKSAEDHSIVELVDSLILHAVHRRASDIHIEPQEKETVVRERIDGVLHRTVSFPPEVHKLVTVRVKVLANLPTDEHAAPLDGKFSYRTPENEKVDLRVSILPTKHGETIVCRVLKTNDVMISLDALGLQTHNKEVLKDQIDRSWGMILVTGPTGSGKTTTLYTIMSVLNSEDVNLSTIEDPVEYDLAGTNQIQVNEKVGLSFASGLRSIVRQDPDIILVGEVRDEETARIAISSAMTGHLVLSTLHTNDAATAFPRLTDMGIEPFLIASTVNLVIAQRLVRRVCVRCKENIVTDLEELEGNLPINILEKLGEGRTSIALTRGRGCEFCQQTGYHGRAAICEFLPMDRKIKELIMKRADSDVIRDAAIEAGMRTMLDDGIAKVSEGVTTIEEVLRVIRS